MKIEAQHGQLPFSMDEYRTRLRRTQEEMAKLKLPVMLLHHPESIFYLSGFFSTGYFSYQALVVPQSGDPVLVIRDMEVASARSTAWVKEYVTYSDSAEPLPVWLDTSKRALEGLGLGGGRIGVDEYSWFLTVERWKMLQSVLPKATLVPEPRIVEHLRVIKSAQEIKYLRQAAWIVEVGLRAGIDAIAPGVSEKNVTAQVFKALVEAGSDGPLSGIILSGSRTDELHGDFTDRRLGAGEPVYFELNGIFQKYWTRLMRTATVGRATDEQKRVADTIISIQDKAIALMQPGTPAEVVDAACREPLLESGIRKTYTNRSGYSLGLNYRPSAGEYTRDIVPAAKWVFEPGQVFHMLMMGGGMGFSETVLVTANGPERLTTMERKLFECV